LSFGFGFGFGDGGGDGGCSDTFVRNMRGFYT
jgi:hypothetical protein